MIGDLAHLIMFVAFFEFNNFEWYNSYLLLRLLYFFFRLTFIAFRGWDRGSGGFQCSLNLSIKSPVRSKWIILLFLFLLLLFLWWNFSVKDFIESDYISCRVKIRLIKFYIFFMMDFVVFLFEYSISLSSYFRLYLMIILFKGRNI